MERHELAQDPRHAPTGERHAHGDLHAFAIALVDDGQQPDSPPVVERRGQRLSPAAADPSGRPPRQIQPQRAVHAREAFVVPRPPLGAPPVMELPDAPPRIARHGVRQRRNDRGIPATRRHRRLVVRRPRQPHHATGSLYWQPMLLYQPLSQLSLRGRPSNVRCRTSLMAACSSARSAYIRLSLACSASSAHRCRTSDPDAPPYWLRHLKNVALLTPCVRHRSGTGTPLSASRRMPTIWVSLTLDFRMTAPWTRAEVSRSCR